MISGSRWRFLLQENAAHRVITPQPTNQAGGILISKSIKKFVAVAALATFAIGTAGCSASEIDASKAKGFPEKAEVSAENSATLTEASMWAGLATPECAMWESDTYNIGTSVDLMLATAAEYADSGIIESATIETLGVDGTPAPEPLADWFAKVAQERSDNPDLPDWTRAEIGDSEYTQAKQFCDLFANEGVYSQQWLDELASYN